VGNQWKWDVYRCLWISLREDYLDHMEVFDSMWQAGNKENPALKLAKPWMILLGFKKFTLR